MKNLRNFIKALNSMYISFVLGIVYLVGVGLVRLLSFACIDRTKDADSYWKNPTSDKYDFESSY